MSIYVRHQYKLFTSYSHNHKRCRSLVERNDFVYEKRMIMLVQMQNIARFIKYIQRSKACTHHSRNAFNANISYSIDFKTVYLPSQRGNLLKQADVAVFIINGLCGSFIGSTHISQVIQFCLIHSVSGQTNSFLTLLSDISACVFGKKHWLNLKHTRDGSMACKFRTSLKRS